MTVFIWYYSGGMVVYTNDKGVGVSWELLWSFADVWEFGAWKSGKIGAYVLEASSDLWAFVAKADSVSSYLGGNISLVAVCTVACLLMVGPVSLGGKFEHCVRFNIGLIHLENFIIALIPLLRNLYCLHVFLSPSETTITVVVAPIIMMIMLIAYAVTNNGSRWAIEMMRLSAKIPNLTQFPPLLVVPHQFSLFLISYITVST